MKNFALKFTRLDGIALVALAIGWAWLFQVDVVRLANTTDINGVVVLAVYLALVVSNWLLARFVWRYFKPEPSKYDILGICRLVAIWAAAEFAMGWIANAILMGHEGYWGNMYPFGSLAPLVMITPLRFMARFAGYFGTSALVGAGLLILYRRQWRVGAYYWSVLVVLATGSWLIYKSPDGDTFTATVISENVSQHLSVDTSRTDFVMVPEYGFDGYEPGDSRFNPTDREIHFSGTKRAQIDRGRTNVLVYGTVQDGITREHTKSRLVAFGEYLPSTAEVYLRVAYREVYDDFMKRRGIVRGEPDFSVYKVSDKIIAGNAACSSITSPDDYRKLTANGATFLGNSASLEVFKNSGIFRFYHNGFATFAAVSNARPFLQSANEWRAFALDHNGKTLAEVNPVGTKDVDVTTNTKTTLYTLLGEWLVFVGFIFGAVNIYGRFKKKNVPAKKHPKSKKPATRKK